MTITRNIFLLYFVLLFYSLSRFQFLHQTAKLTPADVSKKICVSSTPSITLSFHSLSLSFLLVYIKVSFKMLKVRKMKEQQAAAEEAAKEDKQEEKPQSKTETRKQKQRNAAEMIAQKDINEMDQVPGVQVTFPNPDNLMKLSVVITPLEGIYSNAKFKFRIEVPDNYPFSPPKVHCETLVYHPNIDFEGHVCLNILRQEWSPVLNLESVIFGLLALFAEPNPDDPLNREAATLMVERPQDFHKNVQNSLRGGTVAGRRFPQLI